MNRIHIAITILFYLLVGPGPTQFFLNKYTVSLFPLLCFVSVLFLLKDEILQVSIDSILRNPIIWRSSLNGIQWCIYIHAIASLLFKHNENLTELLIRKYTIMPFYVIVVGPILEEIVYRKIIYKFLEKKIGFISSSIISSLLFSAGHFSLDRLLPYFFIGIILCYIYKKTSSILSTITIHMMLNFIAILVSNLK